MPLFGVQKHRLPQKACSCPSSLIYSWIPGVLAQGILFRLIPCEALPETWLTEGFWVSIQSLLPQTPPPCTPSPPGPWSCSSLWLFAGGALRNALEGAITSKTLQHAQPSLQTPSLSWRASPCTCSFCSLPAAPLSYGLGSQGHCPRQARGNVSAFCLGTWGVPGAFIFITRTARTADFAEQTLAQCGSSGSMGRAPSLPGPLTALTSRPTAVLDAYSRHGADTKKGLDRHLLPPWLPQQ